MVKVRDGAANVAAACQITAKLTTLRLKAVIGGMRGSGADM